MVRPDKAFSIEEPLVSWIAEVHSFSCVPGCLEERSLQMLNGPPADGDQEKAAHDGQIFEKVD